MKISILPEIPANYLGIRESENYCNDLSSVIVVETNPLCRHKWCLRRPLLFMQLHPYPVGCFLLLIISHPCLLRLAKIKMFSFIPAKIILWFSKSHQKMNFFNWCEAVIKTKLISITGRNLSAASSFVCLKHIDNTWSENKERWK